jgi:DNA-binding LacI/PurR family transcriptional regulator
MAGICAEAAANNAEIVISFSDPDKFMAELTARYAKGDIQGIIFLEGWDRESMFSALETAGIPYLIANQELDDPALCCRMDFRSIGRQAGRYLIDKGHRHIGVIAGPLDKYLYREMLAGFRGALAEDEVTISTKDIIEPDSEPHYSDIKKLLLSPQRPTAFFAMRDHRSMKLYNACRDLGVRIPEDISVISYDNVTWLEGENVGLTTLEQPLENIGRQSVEILKQWIVSGAKPESRSLQPKLIERCSVKDVS